MKLNVAKGNMYGFITHTGNTIKGKCYHDCAYCYMKRWGNQKPVRFDEKELKIGMGEDKFIFVGSSCDMFNEEIPIEWIHKTFEHCEEYPKNTYLFQSKNPARMNKIIVNSGVEFNYSLCTTIETNQHHPVIMCNSPKPWDRVWDYLDYVTIEPIMKFDLNELLNMILQCDPKQVNIGANSGAYPLPEPSKEDILKLIEAIEDIGIKVHQKPNLKRIVGE